MPKPKSIETVKERKRNSYGTLKYLIVNKNIVSVPEFQDKYN